MLIRMSNTHDLDEILKFEKEAIDRVIVNLRKLYEESEYETEVEFSRNYWEGVFNCPEYIIYRDELMAYFDKRVIEILCEDKT